MKMEAPSDELRKTCRGDDDGDDDDDDDNNDDDDDDDDKDDDDDDDDDDDVDDDDDGGGDDNGDDEDDDREAARVGSVVGAHVLNQFVSCSVRSVIRAVFLLVLYSTKYRGFFCGIPCLLFSP